MAAPLETCRANNTLRNSISIAQPQDGSGGTAASDVTVENQQSPTGTTNSLTLTNGFTRTAATSPVALTFTGRGNTTVGAINTGANSGAIKSSLTKDGTGRLTLNGTSTYTGATNIKQGTLAIGQTDAINADSRLIVGQLQSGSGGSLTAAVSGIFEMSTHNQTFSGVQLNAGSITATPTAPRTPGNISTGDGILTVGGTPRGAMGGTDGIGEF